MPSNTERSKKFRKKIRNDPIQHEEYKKKDRERKKKKYAEKKAIMTESEKSKLREKERLKKRKQAAKKQLMNLVNETEDTFKSPQSLGKAVSRVKRSLPKQDKKKTQVISEVVNSLSPRKRRAVLETCDTAVKRRKSEDGRKTRSDALSKEEIKLVEEFFKRDDISRMCPGKKDFVSVKTPEGRELRQKRLLLLNVNEVYQLFKKEEPGLKIGKSKFASLRPRQVISMSIRDQEVCMCKYHENINMILDGLKNILPNVPKSCEDLLGKTVCSLDQVKCMDRECDDCGISKPLDDLFRGTDEHAATSYYQWETCEDGRVRKELVESTLADAKEDLMEQLQPFGRHVYNIRRQFAELKYLKENLQIGEVIIHEDFAENFQMKHQREVMAAHWSNDTVTLFTAVVYYRSGKGDLEHKCYAVISDDLRHDKQSVYAFNKAILEEIKQITPVTKVHYWSDGPSSQFKNRYNLVNLLFHEQDFGAKATWNFFETAHGKGPMDGVGAEVKRAVWRSILQNKEVVSSPRGFYQAALKVCKNIHLLYVPQAEVDSQTEKLEQRWNGCRAIPRTQAIHFASKANDFTIRVAKNSQFLPSSFAEPCREHILIADHQSVKPTVLSSRKDENSNKECDDENHNDSNDQDDSDVDHDDNDDDCYVVDGDATISINENGDDDDDDDDQEAEEQEKVYVQHGLPPEITSSSMLKNSLLTFQLPPFLAPLIDSIASGRIAFGGSHLVGTDDLKSLYGHGKTSEENWLTNFVVDKYLELVKEASVTTQIEVITWEKFEKGVGVVPAQQVLRGKSPILNQDLVFVPCNSGNSRHWFLLVVQPPLQRAFVLDSIPVSFVKPTAYQAIKKVTKLLKEIDDNVKVEEWSFYTNKPGDIPSQPNDYDCGIFTCMYARSLVKASPMILPTIRSISDLRSYMILELHRNALLPIPPLSMKVDEYYAVDYVSHYYFGRVLHIQGEFIRFKFLHPVRHGENAANSFDWPRRDDVADVHLSCVFYGPVQLQGNSPFTILEHEQVKKVFLYNQEH